jgi:cystathionine beta-lyase/cystathionine gamma-synthase
VVMHVGTHCICTYGHTYAAAYTDTGTNAYMHRCRRRHPDTCIWARARVGLTHARGVWAGFAFASGSAATATLINLFRAGDHILSVNDVYGGTNRYFNRVAGPIGFETTMIDMTDLANVEAAFRPNTKVHASLHTETGRCDEDDDVGVSEAEQAAVVLTWHPVCVCECLCICVCV